MQLSHAVLLAGGTGKNLHPLTSAGTPKALLSVGNQALISFPLRTLEQGGVTHTVVVSRSILCLQTQQMPFEAFTADCCSKAKLQELLPSCRLLRAKQLHLKSVIGSASTMEARCMSKSSV